ncbi:MAG: hypothetical protein AB1668_03980, partial [Nanoarchaeota archaeon]
ILATFNYRTRPEMKVVQEGYQRGPVHIGQVIFALRAYTWTDEQVNNYKKLKEKEMFLLLGEVSSAVKGAMESLGEELEIYLAEARKEMEKKKEEKEKKEEKPQKKSLMERFLGDFYTPGKTKKPSLLEARKSSKAEKEAAEKRNAALESLEKDVKSICWYTYHWFKKAHRMIAW